MKSQHPIDLLPAEIHARSQAGVRAGRYIACSVAGALTLAALTTHARLTLSAAEHDLKTTEVRANNVLEIERKAQNLRDERASLLARTELYDRAALPLEISRIVATIVNDLPPGTTLESLSLNAGIKRPAKSARSKSKDETPDDAAPRLLMGEIGGFASADQAIAELVASLSERAPFANVGLDFSRTRDIRGHAAREFRVSFRIDLDAEYKVLALERIQSPGAEQKGLAHVAE